MNHHRVLNLLLILCLFYAQGYAKLSVTTLFSDHMVIQRNSEVKIWGKATPNQKITVSAGWNNQKLKTTATAEGKWQVQLKTSEAGGPYRVSIVSGKEKISIQDILLGDVWLCSGQSNMEMRINGMTDSPINGSTLALVNASNSQVRMFSLARSTSPTVLDTCIGSWKVASTATVGDFSAVGYFFAQKLQTLLNIPIGIVTSAFGGSRIEAWIESSMIQKHQNAYNQTAQHTNLHHRASYLYNAMIAPISSFPFKGVLWYQGESNINNPNDYPALQSDLVAQFRKEFNSANLPFYFVQIAPYKYPGNKPSAAAYLREAQEIAMKLIPNTGMVTTIDLGNEHNIHPAEKELVAQRLFLWALAETYGIKGLPYKSPMYKSMVIKDSVATITCDHTVRGFHSEAKVVDGFEMAGADSVFHPAKVTIKNGQLLVKSNKVSTPVAVRYLFKNFSFTNGYIFNTAGLPLMPFRTDNW